MNEKTISSKMAAPQCPSGTNWPDHWVTGRVVMLHFGFCERTLRTFVKHKMPKHPIGTKRMCFVLEEVYDWLLKEGALRFAAIGLANTLRQNCAAKAGGPPSTSVSVTVPAGLTVTNSPPSPSAPDPSFNQAVASLVAELKALRKAQTGRRPNTAAAAACQQMEADLRLVTTGDQT